MSDTLAKYTPTSTPQRDPPRSLHYQLYQAVFADNQELVTEIARLKQQVFDLNAAAHYAGVSDFEDKYPRKGSR